MNSLQIVKWISSGYFQVVAGDTRQNFFKASIAEIRYCDRIRKPSLFVLKGNKRIYPGFSKNSNIFIRGCVDLNQDPLLSVIEWSKEWVKVGNNRIVIVRNSYIGGYVLE